ncbi:PDGLE domain-containing protein [Micromonospora sp. WMMD812]|uniref:PDGLE domain-containing protein n=1 Tax=Micromonospora sp. WMMD812 TaxID=3015152 RepID=UPI00248C2E7B|nr:PDGLE domain-containing protein [Micromonospora sp. WMMD812]WBB70622.1 PDGLE domain-containing protein [Micromonospora sp. WMMD812]
MSKRPWAFVVGGLLVALLLAGVVSNYASSHPDGLDSSLLKGCTVDADDNITGGSCPAQQAKDHELADSPLADYGVRGIDNAFLSTGLSGVLGVLLTFAIGGGVFWLLRRRSVATAGSAAGTGPSAGTGEPEGTGAAAGSGESDGTGTSGDAGVAAGSEPAGGRA